jgi:hypothetical protein
MNKFVKSKSLCHKLNNNLKTEEKLILQPLQVEMIPSFLKFK